jgi:uncharacterized protein (TIGR02145 family)
MFGCSKYKRSNELDGIPMLSGITYETSSFDSVRISANIIQENGVYPITKRGFCWSTSSSTPTINDFNCDLGTGFGKLEYWITGLSPNQQIFVRVYATNQAGTKYSDVQEIKSIIGLPRVKSTPISFVSVLNAFSGGKIESDGGAPIEQSGICWSPFTNPTILDSKTIQTNSKGNFTSELVNLSPDTKYYVRAYAKNSKGTSYGDAVEFRTNAFPLSGENLTDIDGNIYKTFRFNSAIWMAENLKVDKLNDGTLLKDIKSMTEWKNSSSPSCTCYDFDGSKCYDFGKIYNFQAVNSNKLCPSGWHVPNDNEWSELIEYLGGSQYAGKELKSSDQTLWDFSNSTGTNNSLFEGLPGGYFENNIGFSGVNTFGFWWSSSTASNMTWINSLNYNSVKVVTQLKENKNGFSVRCKKN